ncbi:unnamed protein product [Calypogeia fissa]
MQEADRSDTADLGNGGMRIRDRFVYFAYYVDLCTGQQSKARFGYCGDTKVSKGWIDSDVADAQVSKAEIGSCIVWKWECSGQRREGDESDPATAALFHARIVMFASA